MREDWEKVELQDVCRIINGRAYKKSELLDEGKYRVLRVGNFFTNKHWYFSDLELDEDKYCDNGDLLYAWSASFGPRIWEGEKVIYHYHIWKMEPNEERVLKEYLHKFLLWDTEKIKSEQGVGTTMIHVTKGSMEERELPIPPLPEQKRIVAILDEAFEAIDQAKANIERNIENAEELFQSKLNEIFNKEIKDWDKTKLEDVCEEIFAGGDTPKENFSKEATDELKVPVIGNAVKNRGLHGFTDEPRVTKSSITIAARGSGTGHTEVRNEPYLPVVRLIVLIPNNEKVRLSFLKYVIDNLEILRSGTAIPQLTVPMIKSYSFHIPDIEVQKQIEEDLDTLSDNVNEIIEVYNQQIESIEELKKSILQKAFLGELTGGESGLAGCWEEK